MSLVKKLREKLAEEKTVGGLAKVKVWDAASNIKQNLRRVMDKAKNPTPQPPKTYKALRLTVRPTKK